MDALLLTAIAIVGGFIWLVFIMPGRESKKANILETESKSLHQQYETVVALAEDEFSKASGEYEISIRICQECGFANTSPSEACAECGQPLVA